MTDAIEKRLAALEIENANLKSQIEVLRLLAPAPKVKPLPPSPVKISHPVSKVSLPTPDEGRRLCEIIWQHYPKLRPGRGEEEEFFAQFSAAIRFVQHTGRRRTVDRERALGWWLDTSRDWIAQHRIGGLPISGMALVVAIIAAGDVPFSDPEEPGFVVGLQFGGGGVPSTDFWRRVLAGTLLEATPALHPMPLPAPSRIVRSAV